MSEVENKEATPIEKPVEPVAVVDLDALDKFKYQGKEWTPEELHAAMLRQQDYTKKTNQIAQERKFYSVEMPKYIDNLAFDLENVKANPEMADKFREIYPPVFHRMLDRVLESSGNNQASSSDAPTGDETKVIRNLQAKVSFLEKKLGKVDELEKGLEADKMSYWDKYTDKLYTDYSQKYPLASEDTVTALALTAKDKGYQITEGMIEKLFRQDHERREGISATRHKERVRQQVEKSKKAKDSGQGSDVPQVVKKRMTISEAAEEAIRHLQGLNR
jgi:hypothetical protein